MKKQDLIIVSTPEDVRRAIAEAMNCFAASRDEGLVRGIDEYFFRLVLDEALDNALHHGNGGDPGKKIRLGIAYGEADVEITVSDEGRGFCPETVGNPLDSENRLKRRGRGVHLVKALGNAQWENSGTCLRVRLVG